VRIEVPPSDTQLLAAGTGGDEAAFGRLFERHARAVYNSDASVVAASDKEELKRLRKNFLIKKLGLQDDEMLDAGIAAVIEQYGRNNRNKHRAVFYYLLVKHFGRESAYE
jgi:hypothetical protein